MSAIYGSSHCRKNGSYLDPFKIKKTGLVIAMFDADCGIIDPVYR